MKQNQLSTISAVNELLSLEDEQREPTKQELEECDLLVQSLDLMELLQNEEV